MSIACGPAILRDAAMQHATAPRATRAVKSLSETTSPENTDPMMNAAGAWSHGSSEYKEKPRLTISVLSIMTPSSTPLFE